MEHFWSYTQFMATFNANVKDYKDNKHIDTFDPEARGKKEPKEEVEI